MLDLVQVSSGVIAYILLLVLPGAWLSFGPLGRSLSPWSGIFIAVTLSPLVLVTQFHAVRLLGVSFDATAILLVCLNLPAARFIYCRFSGAGFLGTRDLVISLMFLAAPLILLFVHLQDIQIRALYAHAWRHADIAYRVIAGDLWPQEASLAGFMTLYAWGWSGHIYQALLSNLVNIAPVSSYAWTNAIWLMTIFGITATVVAKLGGNHHSQSFTMVFLAFAVNPIGSSLEQILAPDLLATYSQYLGDPGYSPWLRKFFGFDQLPLALGSFAALWLLTVQSIDTKNLPSIAALSSLQLCTLGIVYPVLFPAGCIVLIARMISCWLVTSPTRTNSPTYISLAMAGTIVLAIPIVYSVFGFMSGWRWGSLVPTFKNVWGIKIGAVKSIVALSIPLIGFAFAAPLLWRSKREMIVLVTVVTVIFMGVYSVFAIPFAGNEYKYVLAAAICLAPFPALALEPVIERLGRGGVLVSAIVVVALVIPPSLHLFNKWPPVVGHQPKLVIEGLNVALASNEQYAGALAAIRDTTPPEGIVVAAGAEVHLPTLTRRIHYAPYEGKSPLAGYTAGPDYFLTKGMHGKGRQLEQRRRVLNQLFYAEIENDRVQALADLWVFDRPIIILVDLDTHAALQVWLFSQTSGQMIYRDHEAAVWVLRRI